LALLDEYRRGLAAGTLPVGELAKSETLHMNPDAYERFIAEGGKPRRAAAEAALQITPRPRMGERVRYYVTAKTKGRTSDWQRARPLEMFDPLAAPYDADYYAAKLDDWRERYAAFLGGPTETPPVQGELF
jgi:DNA polymerase elongation subunit (family B)